MKDDDHTQPIIAASGVRSHDRTALDTAHAGPLGLLGRYRLIRKLGEGGMAQAFLAEAVGHDGFVRAVALKRPLPEPARDEAFVKAFVEEAKIAARLTHTNVVQVVDLDLDPDGRPYMVMELVDGCSLDRLLAAPMRLPLSIVVYVIASVLRGLCAAHELTTDNGIRRNVVHRDVSPDNVFLSRDGAVKVADWGIAKATAAAENRAATRPGYLKGKPSYMAPEHAWARTIDQRADLFAVGVILWEMLTGQRVVPPSALQESVIWAQNRRFERPSTIAPDVPADLEVVVMRLLEPRADDRYESAREAIAAIEECAAAQVGACDQLAALVAGLTPDAPRHATRPGSRLRSRAAGLRRRTWALVAGGLVVVGAAVAVGIALGGRDRQAADRAPVAIAVDAAAAPFDAPQPPDAASAPPGDRRELRDRVAVVNPFVTIAGSSVMAQGELVSREAYRWFVDDRPAAEEPSLRPIADWTSGDASSAATWIAFEQAQRFCAAIDARLPVNEQWVQIAHAIDVGPQDEWTGTVENGFALIREPGDRGVRPKDKRQKPTQALAGPRAAPEEVADANLGFRCVR